MNSDKVMEQQPPEDKTPEYYEKLLEKHGLLKTPLDPARRERFLPTKDQLRVVLAFVESAEICRSVKGTERVRGQEIPAYAVCVGSWVPRLLPEVELTIQRNPQWFEGLYRRVYW